MFIFYYHIFLLHKNKLLTLIYEEKEPFFLPPPLKLTLVCHNACLLFCYSHHACLYPILSLRRIESITSFKVWLNLFTYSYNQKFGLALFHLCFVIQDTFFQHGLDSFHLCFLFAIGFHLNISNLYDCNRYCKVHRYFLLSWE